MTGTTRAALAAALLLALPATALAHATLETAQAPSGSYYKAVIRIGHGCDGSPTTTVRVRVPEGVVAVKPMPKSGWTLSTVEGTYATPYENHGQTITKGVTEVVWTGGTLPDAWYDEFVFRAKLPEKAAGTVLHFPIVQECEKGVHRWIEIPEPGRSTDDYKEPAPTVTLTAKP
ncbi:uncharacterized protein YcnI [Azospirillum agricola]|uniref:YcnI family copper-binding membrane protein n=1 Tax=Azospirillum agricola TaxID=1720247 RepID=UPI001AE8D429|nr:YcnI family protein [Azospirillum agricola]MBP2232240.1 uncharacterized protein YcnI [Azospirillum agricola]